KELVRRPRHLRDEPSERRSGIPRKAATRKHEVETRIRIAAPEPVARVVSRAPELRQPGDGVDLSRVGMNAEIASADIDALPRARGLDRAAAIAVCGIEPAVEAPREAVREMLLVPVLEAAVERLASIGLTVAVRILGVEDLRDGDDDGALSPRLRRRRKAQAIEKDARAVVAIV